MSNQFKGLCANPFMFDYYQQWFVSSYLFTCLCITSLYYRYRIIPGAVCITLFIPLYYPLHLHRHLWPPQRPGGANLAPDLPADQNAVVLFTYSWRKAKLLKLTKRANMIFGKSRPCASKYGSKFKSSPKLPYNQSHIIRTTKTKQMLNWEKLH